MKTARHFWHNHILVYEFAGHAAMRCSIFPKLCHESEWLSWNQQPSRFGFRVLGACDARLAQIASGKHTKSAIEHGMYSWFTHSKWWFSIVFLYVYQRVTGSTLQAFQGNPAGGSWDHEQLHCLEILRQSPSQKPSPKFPIFPNLGLDEQFNPTVDFYEYLSKSRSKSP